MEEQHEAGSTAQRWWKWFQEKATTKNAEWWLGTYSFFETVILPFPTDPFLALLVLANRHRAVWLTALTTLTSFAGSLFLFAATVFFYTTLVEPLVNAFGMQAFVTSASATVAAYTFAAVFFGAFSPLPYTPVVIAAGLLQVNVIPFALGAFLGRAVRYTLVTTLTLLFGITLLKRIGKVATILTVIALAGAALYFAFTAL